MQCHQALRLLARLHMDGQWTRRRCDGSRRVSCALAAALRFSRVGPFGCRSPAVIGGAIQSSGDSERSACCSHTGWKSLQEPSTVAATSLFATVSDC